MAISSGDWLVLGGPDETTRWGGLEGTGVSKAGLHLVVSGLQAAKGPLIEVAGVGVYVQVGTGESGVAGVCSSPSS